MTVLQHRLVICEQLGLGNIEGKFLGGRIMGSLTAGECGQVAALRLSPRHSYTRRPSLLSGHGGPGARPSFSASYCVCLTCSSTPLKLKWVLELALQTPKINTLMPQALVLYEHRISSSWDDFIVDFLPRRTDSFHSPC